MLDKVLFVDDDVRILNGFKRRFYKKYQFHTAVGAKEAFKSIEDNGPFAVVISDQQMPGMDGITFLKQLMDSEPLTVRIMLTGNADRQTAVESVNESHVFRYLNKPCSMEDLTEALDAAIERHRVLKAERDLLEQTLAGSVKVLVDILALRDPKAVQMTGPMRKAARYFAKYLKYRKVWELDMAVMLAPIGEIVLPPIVRTKLHNGEALDKMELEALQGAPGLAKDLLLHIPRLQSVADAVHFQSKGFDGSGYPFDHPGGKEIPLNARILMLLKQILLQSKGQIPKSDVFDTLESSKHLFDPELFEAAKQCFLGFRSEEGTEFGELEVMVCDLVAGDRLLDDLKTEDGELALAANNELTDVMIAKVLQFHKLRGLREPVRILRERLQTSLKTDNAA